MGLRYDVIRNEADTAQHSNGMGGWAGASTAYVHLPRYSIQWRFGDLRSNGELLNMVRVAIINSSIKLVLALMMANMFSEMV